MGIQQCMGLPQCIGVQQCMEMQRCLGLPQCMGMQRCMRMQECIVAAYADESLCGGAPVRPEAAAESQALSFFAIMIVSVVLVVEPLPEVPLHSP